MNEAEKKLLEEVSALHEIPQIYNIRLNGKLVARAVDSDVNIESKADKDGINIYVKQGTKNKSVHIPVIVSQKDIKDKVFNDFYIEDNCDILIVAGCGISCNGNSSAGHNGIHSFYIGKNCNVRYVEKHIGDGDNLAKRELDPVTNIVLGENSTLKMETSQLRGVTRSIRTTKATLDKNAKLFIKESMLTDDKDFVRSVFDVELNGMDSKVDIVSRSVAQGSSRQEFVSTVSGKNKCFGHVECDGIVSDSGMILSTPTIVAEDKDAMLVHEAAIGKISDSQIEKLMTLGLNKEDAEREIINGFLR